MAYIDNELKFYDDTACAASMNSTVLDLGTNGAWANPLLIDVKLTAGIASGTGTVTSIKLQSASDSAMTTPVTEIEIVPPSAGQTAPMTLAQFFAPIRIKNRYVRLVTTVTVPVGQTLATGKISAFMTAGATIRL